MAELLREAIAGPVRLSVNLSPEVATTLRDMAEAKGKTISDTVRDAIGLEKFLTDEREKGSELLVRYPNGKTRTVVMVYPPHRPCIVREERVGDER